MTLKYKNQQLEDEVDILQTSLDYLKDQITSNCLEDRIEYSECESCGVVSCYSEIPNGLCEICEEMEKEEELGNDF